MPRPLPIRLGGAVREAAYIAKNLVDHGVALAMRFSPRHQPYLTRRLRTYRGQRSAVFLFHGYLQWGPTFNRLEKLLDLEPLDLFPVNCDYQPYSQDLRRSADEERSTIDWVLAKTDVREVFLVGHSQGGIIAREIAQRQTPIRGLTRVVTLSSPHQGTYTAHVGNVNWAVTRALRVVPGFPRIDGESGRQINVGSRYLESLNACPLPRDVTFVSIFNHWDPFVTPTKNARMPYPEATNICLDKPGHFHPLYDVDTHALVVRALFGRLRESQGERLDLANTRGAHSR
ncbi:MAG: hypothetical protein HYY84_05650 [Deltaproteobacteria bacterium]|nr:hypothetical protein [Deltaproteobacteria bacterium]